MSYNQGTAWIPMIRAVYNVAAGSCSIALLNARAEIDANATLYLAYEVVN